MKKVLYLTVGFSALILAGAASAQFSDHRPPPQINFSRSPRTMAEEALNDSRKNKDEAPAFVVDDAEENYVTVVGNDGVEVIAVKAVAVEVPNAEVVEIQSVTEYEEVIKIPRKPKTIYDVIDANGDGLISKEEYDAFAQERTNKIYADMDENGDGLISSEEFNRYKARR